nr:rhodanese-like domain-containing protein [Vibrio taketomensis]
MIFKLLSQLSLAILLTSTTASVYASQRADTAWQLIDQGAMIVDVRTPGEFAAGHLDNAINYPLAELDRHFQNVDKSRHIVVYCRSGNRSGIAYDYLIEQGFTRVHNGGGLDEMRAAE